MFERFVRLAQARKALKAGHYEQALQHLGDPLVKRHRRAEDIRREALKGLLSRARRRADSGGMSAALSDVARILAAQPEFDGAKSLQAALEARQSSAGERAKEARKLLKEARLLAEGGDLEGALAICGVATDTHNLLSDEEGLKKLILGRRTSAQDFFAKAQAALAAGDLVNAQTFLGRARALDQSLPEAADLGQKLAHKVAEGLLKAMRELDVAGQTCAALARESSQRASLPELATVSKLQVCVRQLSEKEADRIAMLVKKQSHQAALAAFRKLDPSVQKSTALSGIGEGLSTLQAALDFDATGSFALAERGYSKAAELLGVKELKSRAKEMAGHAGLAQELLHKARDLASEGQLVEAREALLQLLQKWPTHEGARREMEILDQGAQDKDQRMAAAREFAKAGKLREASAFCLSLAVPGSYGDEARLLVRDLQARMDLVSSGVQQVLGALHNRDSCSVEGLTHSLSRLEELRGVQVDDAELESVKNAVTAEIAALATLGRAEEAMQAGQKAALADLIEDFAKLRGQLLSADRLAARSQDLAELVIARAGEDLAGGRLRDCEAWLGTAARLSTGSESLEGRIARLHDQTAERQSQAEELAAQGRTKMQKHDLDGAETSLAAARAAWTDGPTVKRLEGELRKLRGQSEDIADVESMAKDKDYGAARRRMGQMGPTEDLMRTRIYDLKKSLAKAQGLDHAFLLRVDEGGEFIVMRGESLTIGNVREGSCDLPILANLAGQHARITRSMSFHGGMQDRLLPERGTISVRGRGVSEHKLRSGDRVTLGTALELEYRIPSSRSLSASLTIRGGFQVSGTDRILLMKDRGRDGRILIGAAKDVHVSVPNAEGEVEIFAGKDGQVRARFDGQGDMDGRPFTGEHPITAGATVTCGNVTFVLLPWSRADALSG